MGTRSRTFELGSSESVSAAGDRGYKEAQLLALFPNLALGSFRITSRWEPAYNCIAWASGDTDAVWQPPRVVLSGEAQLTATYWPRRAPAEWTKHAIAEVFRLQSYRDASPNERENEELDRIAIYATESGVPTHVAWSSAGMSLWASKLGRNVDIVHSRPSDIEGKEFGMAQHFMCREPDSSTSPSPRLPSE